MQNFLKFILQNVNYIKYGLLILVIFSMIFSVRTYLKHVSIEEEIAHVDANTEHRIEEMNYNKKFVYTYLGSDYAEYFGKHENNGLFNNEYIIKFEPLSEKEKTIEEEPKETLDINPLGKPRDAWKHFFQEKWNQIPG